ncbi:MAG: hypothetical protein R3253_14710 [Longimicrobiales bacterium]|nr:hypothetical protein [Longimicrobiales bacterium]
MVSDPPHGQVDEDTVSRVLGLDPDTTALKVAFPAPEVLAASGPQRAHDIGDELTDAGLHIRVIPGHDLAEIPWPRLARSPSFGSDGLVARVGDDRVEIPYSAQVWCVSCRPPEDFSAEASVSLSEAEGGPGPRVAEALEWTPHLDLYYGSGGTQRRVTLVDDVPHALEEVERLFHRVGVDRRLEGIRPRQRFVAGDHGFDIDLRKAFSFGTLLLRQILQSISEELRDIPQYEFASRLSFATRPGSGAP